VGRRSPSAASLLASAALAALVAYPGTALSHSSDSEIEKNFRKVERHLDGPDADLRAACGAPARAFAVEDRPAETAKGVTRRLSDVTFSGASGADLRNCARGVVRAGVVEGWRLAPATDGNGYTLSMRLLRARRDPHNLGWQHTDDSDREAAASLTAMWKSHVPAAEALAPEVLAPDLVNLTEAAWNAGNVTIEGTAADERFADAYDRVLKPLTGSLHVERKIDLVRPDDGARLALDPVVVPPRGLLRAAVREAPPSAVLRVFAELDRRDFVMPSGGARRNGTVAGGWNGVVQKLAADLGRAPRHVGAIDVFAPIGSATPPEPSRSGKRVDLDLEGIDPSKVFTLLAVAGGVEIRGPAGLPSIDVHLRAVPWDQALDAVAATHGCRVTIEGSARVVHCPTTVDEAEVVTLDVTPAGAENEKVPADIIATKTPTAPDPVLLAVPPLERFPASALRVVALATREGGSRWVAVVQTPDGLDVTVRTGVRIGIDGGLAVVDEHGVSVVLKRADADGNAVLTAIPLVF
jgi:hypothetical protein